MMISSNLLTDKVKQLDDNDVLFDGNIETDFKCSFKKDKKLQHKKLL